jgi:hypothetical protein
MKNSLLSLVFVAKMRKALCRIIFTVNRLNISVNLIGQYLLKDAEEDEGEKCYHSPTG